MPNLYPLLGRSARERLSTGYARHDFQSQRQAHLDAFKRNGKRRNSRGTRGVAFASGRAALPNLGVLFSEATFAPYFLPRHAESQAKVALTGEVDSEPLRLEGERLSVASRASLPFRLSERLSHSLRS
jgi:hypothetical protein